MTDHLGIVFTEVGPDFLKATMPVDERTRQPFGVLNGGASAALVETIASTASAWCVDAARQYGAGIEINASHLRAVRDGHVTATATPIRLGRTLHVWQVDLYDDAGRHTCVARMTAAIVDH